MGARVEGVRGEGVCVCVLIAMHSRRRMAIGPRIPYNAGKAPVKGF